ncbi:MAG: SBBP repeat-containing protein [Bryobacteraceae bacterium]
MNYPTYHEKHRVAEDRIRKFALAIAFLSTPALAQQSPLFTPGNLVVVVEGCGVFGGTCTAVPNGTGTGAGNSSAGGYGDNQAGPLTLFQYMPNGTASVAYVNSLVLPQTGSGANLPVSGEYGSSSEGTLQLSGSGQYLTIMGYGINAAAFDAAYYPPFTGDPYGAAPSGALAQSGSLTGQSYTPVARVLTLIDPYGNVNSSTALYNIFNTNNPRSVYTANGTTAYVSGQGSGSDATGGVFYTAVGAANTAPTAITGLDTTSKTLSQDTRDVQIYNNTLYVSVDSKEGSGSNRDFIGTLGTPPATSLFNSGAGPTQLSGIGTSNAGKETITSGANSNGNNLNSGQKINISPVNYFFASPSVLYVADGGNPKNDSNGDNNSNGTNNIGDGGLQKWINSQSNGSGAWSLAYTLYQGLNLVNNGSGTGTSGLYGLTGTVSGSTVLLYATNYTLSDLDPTYLYGITDTLNYTTASQASGEVFSLLDTAPSDSNFKGVSFAPVTPNGSVIITSSPSGFSFTSAGTGCSPGSYTTPQTLSWTPGSTCTLSVASPISGGTGVQYAFAQWQDGATSTTDTVTAPATPATYTATYTTQYLLTTSAGMGGSVSAGGYVAAGTNAIITATPSAGYYFVNFTGTATSTSNPFSLLMNQPQSITANFAAAISQTITFPALSNQVLGAAPFTVNATASSGLPVSFASLTAPVCTVSGTTVTLVTAGGCTIQATQAGGGGYLAAMPVNQTFQVASPGLGTIGLIVGSAGGSASVILNYGGAWSATSNASFLHISAGSASGTGSGLVSFTYDPFTGTGTQTGTLSIGSLTLTVTQAGTNYFGPGPVVALVSSGLTSPYGVAVDSSGNIYIADQGTGAIYEWNATMQQVTTLIASGVLSGTGVAVDGSGNVYFFQADLGLYEWIASTQQVTLLAGSGLSAPTGLAVDAYGDVYMGDSGGAVNEWSASTQQVTTLFSVGSAVGLAVDASGNVYTVGGGAVNEWSASTQQVTPLVSAGLNNPSGVAVDGSGNVYIADSGNNAVEEWSASTQQTTTLAPTGLNNPSGVAVDGSGNIYIADTGNQAIKEIPYAFVGPASGLTEPATAGSDALLPVLPATAPLTGIFAPTSNQSWLTIGTIAGGVVNFSFTANASNASQTAQITILGQQISVTQNGLTAQTITFGPLSNQPYGAAPFTVSATASSGLAVSFASTTPGVCSVSVATVTVAALGTCTIQATQAGNTTYAPATPVSQSFQVTQASQTITFGALSNEAYGAPPFTVAATANSGLTVRFNSQTPHLCSVSGATVTLLAVGTCTIQANQPGNADYAAAPVVDQSFQVSQGSQTITFGALSNQAYGTPPFTVGATASSGLAVRFNSQTPHYCSVSGTSVTLLALGTCTIQATQPGNADYAAAPAVNQSFQVMQGSQTISFGPLANQAYGAAPFTVGATASSGLTVRFNSQTPRICGVSGTTVTLLAVGTCTVQATQPGNADYAAAPAVDQSFQVTQGSQTITFGPLANQTLGNPPFTVSATASSGLAVTFSSQTPRVCTVSGTTVTLAAVGTCTIQAAQRGNADWAAATPVYQSFTVAR